MKKVVALIKVRGFGSTLEGKNMYPVNGLPVLGHAIRLLMAASFIDRIYVWSESDEIKKFSHEMGAVPLDRPLSMVHYHSGFHTDHEYNFHSLEQMKADLKEPIEVIVNFNCNYAMFETSSLERMFAKLYQDAEARTIVALAKVESGFCLDNGRYGLFPFMNDSNVMAGAMPELYRKLGISMFKCGIQYAALKKQIFLRVSNREGIDIHEPSDVLLMEYYLQHL